MVAQVAARQIERAAARVDPTDRTSARKDGGDFSFLRR
jgi:hypothetical protein